MASRKPLPTCPDGRVDVLRTKDRLDLKRDALGRQRQIDCEDEKRQ